MLYNHRKSKCFCGKITERKRKKNLIKSWKILKKMNWTWNWSALLLVLLNTMHSANYCVFEKYFRRNFRPLDVKCWEFQKVQTVKFAYCVPELDFWKMSATGNDEVRIKPLVYKNFEQFSVILAATTGSTFGNFVQWVHNFNKKCLDS